MIYRTPIPKLVCKKIDLSEEVNVLTLKGADQRASGVPFTTSDFDIDHDTACSICETDFVQSNISVQKLIVLNRMIKGNLW